MISSQMFAAAMRAGRLMSAQAARHPKGEVRYQARQSAGWSDQSVIPVRGSRMMSAPLTTANRLGAPEGKTSGRGLTRTAR